MGKPTSAVTRILLLGVAIGLGAPTPQRQSTAETLILKNGMRLEGTVGKIAALGQNPLAPTGGGGKIHNQLIVLVDDELTRTFVCTFQVQEKLNNPPAPLERIKIEQRVARQGPRVGGVGSIINIGKWDPWGRRVFTMNTVRGKMDVVQGITEITPRWTKVEGLLGRNSIVWDMRINTNSIPRATLSSVLLKQIDPSRADDRLQIVRLYVQAERYQDAQAELEAVVKDFPELSEYEKQIKTIRQMGSQRLIKEIQRYRDAGQHVLAHRLLSTFPDEGVAGETLLKISEMLKEYDKARDQGLQVLELLEDHLADVKGKDERKRIEPVVEEIAAELNINSLSRMADYLRLADDKKLGSEQKISLAVSGWLLGAGSGTENLAVALSLYEVRNLVRAYLRSTLEQDREVILDKLADAEGATPNFLAEIIAQMKPPIETPDPKDPKGIYGYYTLSAPGLTGQADVTYYLQIPPEYDPYRRYPAIVTLNAGGTTPPEQIDWWAGAYSEKAKARIGQAARRGAIVIAPVWTKEHQRKYEYSAREHAAVLHSLRDAIRRFSIDTDRVFLTGHSMGGDAAWDIGLAHPDLWAGVIPFVPVADKYVSRYWENAKTVPLYFVTGELDGDKLSRNAQDLNRYLTKAGFDVMVAEYLGRGHEHFHDEIQRVFTWMESQKRDFYPGQFKCVTMRRWDNYFWWVELDGFPSRSVVNPVSWPPRSGTRPVSIEAKINANNRLSLTTGAGRVTAYLSPEIVDFEKRLSITVNGRSRSMVVKPTVKTLLEDVRTRGDRQHPFWAKVELDTGRGGR